MITRSQVLSIGTITRAFGKQGALLCRTTNEYWEQSSSPWLILSLDHILVPFRVNDWYTKGTDGIVFTLQDITTEQQAQPLLQAEAFMLRSDLSETDENAVAWTDLVGYTVIDTDQGPLGTITSIDDTTANILAYLSAEGGPSGEADPTAEGGLSAQRSLIPLHEDFLVSIDPEAHQLTITLPYLLQ